MEAMFYAFGIGLSFISGLAFGGWLLSRMSHDSVAKFANESRTQKELILAHNERVEDRLDRYVAASQEIAHTLKKLVRSNTG